MKTALLMLMTVMVGVTACDDAETSTTSDSGIPSGATTFTLSPEGGAFVGVGDLEGVVLRVPSGAVEADVELWMAPPTMEMPLPETGRFVGPEVEFGPHEVSLGEAATITMPIEAGSLLEAEVESRFVKVWRLSAAGWVIDEPVATATASQVSVEISSLTRFGAGIEID